VRKAWSLALTPLAALAVSVALTTPARAFGAEVLGCDAGGGWTANTCSGQGLNADITVGYIDIDYAVHNLSGTYAYAWTKPTNATIYSGCTATTSVCDIEVPDGFTTTHYYTVSVKLTQSGQSRTLSATAAIKGAPICPPGGCP
jgi:hypothetical protein